MRRGWGRRFAMGAGVSKKGTVVPRTIHVEEKRLDDPIASATPNPGDPCLSSGEEVKEDDGGGDDDDGTADCGGCGHSSGSAAAAPAPAALPPPHAPKPKGGKGGDRLTSAKSAPAGSFRTQRYSSVSALSGQPMPSWLLQQQQQAAAAGAAGGTARVPSPGSSEGSTEFDTMAHAGLARCKRLILVRHGQACAVPLSLVFSSPFSSSSPSRLLVLDGSLRSSSSCSLRPFPPRLFSFTPALRRPRRTPRTGV